MGSGSSQNVCFIWTWINKQYKILPKNRWSTLTEGGTAEFGQSTNSVDPFPNSSAKLFWSLWILKLKLIGLNWSILPKIFILSVLSLPLSPLSASWFLSMAFISGLNREYLKHQLRSYFQLPNFLASDILTVNLAKIKHLFVQWFLWQVCFLKKNYIHKWIFLLVFWLWFIIFYILGGHLMFLSRDLEDGVIFDIKDHLDIPKLTYPESFIKVWPHLTELFRCVTL